MSKKLSATLEGVTRLLPALRELESLRLRILQASVPDPGKEWASSSYYSTIDKRLISLDALETSLDRWQEDACREIETFSSAYKKTFHAYLEGDPDGAASHLLGLADVEEQGGRYDRALAILHVALNLSLPLLEKTNQIVALRRIGRAYASVSEFQQAILYYNRGAELARDAGDLHNHIIAKTGSGNVLQYLSRWVDAEPRYREVLAALEEADPEDFQLERAQLYTNLGSVTMRLGRLEESDAWFARSLEVFSRIPPHRDLGVCYHNLGGLRLLQGDYAESRKMLQQALAVEPAAAVRATIAADLVLSYVREGLLSEAEYWGREAERFGISSRSPYNIVSTYVALGALARARRDEGGVTFFEKAWEIAREKNLVLVEAETLEKYALFRHEMGQTDEARAYLQRAMDIFRKLGCMDDFNRAESMMKEYSDSSREAVVHQ